MSRLSLPILAALASAMAISPLVASAQVERAALDLPAFSSSSSSSSDMFAAPAGSSAAAPAKPAPEGSTRPFSSLGIGVKVGVAGIGFDVATPLVPTRLNLRGGATFFSYNLNETTNDNLNVVGNLKLQNSGVMLDWFPFHGSFRLSGGGTVYNNKSVTATINVPSTSSFTLGGTTYYSSSTAPIVGTGTFKLGGNAGGRVSFGWGNLVPKAGHHFSFDTELGIEFVSKPTVALGFTGNYCTTSGCGGGTPIAGNAAFAANVATEQSKLQNDVNFLSFYPIISVGFGYKFGR